MVRKRSGTAVEEIYQILYDRIVSGKYPPGLRMSQADLAAELSVSRTPLREALNRLQANGLVVANNNRGMEVAGAHYEEMEQLYAIRLLVEPPLIAAIVNELSPADIDAMAAALCEMEKNSYATQAFQGVHLKFHNVALAYYPDTIREMIESIYGKIVRHQRLHFSRPHVPEDFTNVDRFFLDAMREGDALLARQWLEFHLIDAALGLALDIDPDQAPRALLKAAKGIGITIECGSDRFTRPARIEWKRADACAMPAIETVNLKFVPRSKPLKSLGAK